MGINDEMKEGDLVTLSKYGESRKINNNCKTGYGIVLRITPQEIVDRDDLRFPIWVQWFECDKVFEFYFSRRELKLYKPDKNCPLQKE